jgi:hypothetical protein
MEDKLSVLDDEVVDIPALGAGCNTGSKQTDGDNGGSLVGELLGTSTGVRTVVVELLGTLVGGVPLAGKSLGALLGDEVVVLVGPLAGKSLGASIGDNLGPPAGESLGTLMGDELPLALSTLSASSEKRVSGRAVVTRTPPSLPQMARIT